MATIYLDARATGETPTGTGRYASGLVGGLVGLDPPHRFVVIRRPAALGAVDAGSALAVSQHRTDGVGHYLFGARELRRLEREHGVADLYHSMFHVLPRGLRPSLPVVLSLHDLFWLTRSSQTAPTPWRAAMTRAFAQRALPYAISRADHVVCVSPATRDSALRWLRPGRSSVIPPGVDDVFRNPRRAVPNDDVPTAPYFAAIASPKKYKNVARLIEGFAVARRRGLGAKLVLVGDSEGLDGSIRAHEVGDRVARLGHLDDSAWCAVVREALAFVFPSLCEGFGLPPFEAMALGVPVVLSDVEPMTDRARDAALTFDPTSADELAAALLRMERDCALRRDLVERGRAVANELQWRSAAERMLDVYEHVLSERTTSRTPAVALPSV